MTSRRGFDTETVDFGNPALSRLPAITKNRSGQRLFTALCHYLSSDRRREFGSRAQVAGGDGDATFFRNQERVHNVYSRAYISQQAGEKGTRDRRGIEIDDFSRILEPDLLHRAANQLRLDST